MVERDGTMVAFEIFVAGLGPRDPRRVRPRQAEPGGGRRLRPFGEDPLKRLEAAATWLKTPSSRTLQPAGVRLCDELVKVRVIAQPGIDAVVVGGVISVGLRGEDGAEGKARRSKSTT